MRKKMTSFLILIFVSGLIPLNITQAITQNQIDAEVQIVCPDDEGNWYSGSGTIVDSKGIILTNKHVVTNKKGDVIKTCIIGFIESINKEPNFFTGNDVNLAEVKYYTTSSDMDAAILYLNNPTNKIYSYVNIWDSDSDDLKLGDKIEVVGFPSIGGSTITYTSGDFSGFGSSSNGMKNHIKTTAILEHGNSGGAAYDSNGQFIGIPTAVIVGSLNSIGYILSVNSIKDWLSGVLGSNYQQEVIKQEPIIEKPTLNIQNDITPPMQKEFFISFSALDDDNNEIYYGNRYGDTTAAMYEFSKIKFSWKENCSSATCIVDNNGNVKGYYYYFGSNPTTIPQNQGTYISADKLESYRWGNEVQLAEIFEIKEGEHKYFILQAEDSSGNISNPLINFEYIYEPDKFKDIKSFTIQNQNKDTIGVLTYPARDTWDYESRVIETDQASLIFCPDYGYEINGLIYYISYQADRWWHDKTREGIITDNKCITVNNLDSKGVTNLFIKPGTYGANSFLGKYHILAIHYLNNVSNSIQPANKILSTNWSDNTVYWRKSENNMTFQAVDTNLLNQLKGKILLQVEQNGEAYYVYPDDSKKYYLGRPADAFNVMRKLGLGATHEFITSHTVYPDNVLGKILLDVEQNGEAYYIYPEDKKAYYLGRPADAFEIMRELGLGITNGDLSKIPEGNL